MIAKKQGLNLPSTFIFKPPLLQDHRYVHAWNRR